MNKVYYMEQFSTVPHEIREEAAVLLITAHYVNEGKYDTVCEAVKRLYKGEGIEIFNGTLVYMVEQKR